MKVLRIGEHDIALGATKRIELPVVSLYTDTSISMPVYIHRSTKPGPTLFVSAAIHGDELNGIEIIKRLITRKTIKLSKGTLIAVPMVNIYGVVNQSRYLPDRRDLNRSFPGSAKGSLAGRVANIVVNEIIKKSDYGIDLHTGAIHRSNLPQIRANLADDETKALACAFAAPVVLDSNILDGSLRDVADQEGCKVLVYEAGEALRFDEFSVRAGVKGIINVMSHLGMIRKQRVPKKAISSYISYKSGWVRANASGIVSHKYQLGDQVKKNQIIADIASPFGELIDTVRANRSGIIIGKQNIPLVQEGEAMYHIAFFDEDDEEIVEQIEQAQEQLTSTEFHEGDYER